MGSRSYRNKNPRQQSRTSGRNKKFARNENRAVSPGENNGASNKFKPEFAIISLLGDARGAFKVNDCFNSKFSSGCRVE